MIDKSQFRALKSNPKLKKCSKQQHRTIKQSAEHSDNSTQETRLAIPVPKVQTKINQPYCNLDHIPETGQTFQIKQLYISHNNIISVKGLSKFKNLQSLNLSFNKISNLAELLHQFSYLNHLQKLSIRMNALPYGYQDQIIKNKIKTLNRLDDYELGKYSQKKNIFLLAQQISCSLALCMLILKKKIAQISNACLSHSYASELLNHKLIVRISKFYRSEKKTYLPCDRNKILEHIYSQLEAIAMIKQKINGNAEIREQFGNLTTILLQKFAARNNNKILNTLMGQNTNIQQENIVMRFGHIFGGYKYDLRDAELPGRYIKKINPQRVANHPYLKYLEADRNKENIQNETSLNPHFKPKRLILEQIYQDNQQQERIYERFPIIIYQRNYLQVLSQIITERIGQFLRISDKLEKIKRKLIVDYSSAHLQQQEKNAQTTQKIIFEPELSQFPEQNLQKQTLNQTKDAINIQKYSLHQINLAYKVFIGLKLRKQRKTIIKKLQEKYSYQ